MIETGRPAAVGEGEALGVAPAVVPQQATPVAEQTLAADEQAVAASVAAALDPQLVTRLAAQARSQGVSLLGRDGLLQQLTKRFLEATLEAEMDEHLGYGKHEAAGRNGGNSRNGYRSKTLLTEVGPVDLEVPRDREASFAPQVVAKRQRRLGGIDELVISLTAKGLTTGEVCAHLAEVYGAKVSKDHISTITDRVLETMGEWQNRPLDAIYPVIFIDCIHVKIRDGQVANRPVYVALAVTADGGRDILGLWAGDGGEGAKYWLRVLAELKTRGVGDVCIVVCDGLKGLPEAIGQVWPAAVVQTCIIHLLRNSFTYSSRRDWSELGKDLRPVYTAPSESAALDAFAEFSGKWERRYPAIIKLWENAWAEFVPFLRFDPEIRKIICTTNAIESLNARFRRAVNARGHFPTEQAALKVLYLTVRSLDPTGRGAKKWSNRWKAALNALDITFDGRISAARR
jgi:transposase-like protein